MFMKNPDAVIGPGDTIVLPEFTVPWAFMHEAELALVIKGPAKMVKAKDWKSAVFGYTALIDVSAREQGRRTWPATPLTSWLGKSFDTFAPIGPCIATADEIKDPNDLIVRFWNDGQLRHNYNTDDMEHRVPELVEFATTVMTMNSGDLIACGTNHEGLGALQDGETRRHRNPEHRQDDAEGVAIRSSASGSAASTWASIRPIPTRSSATARNPPRLARRSRRLETMDSKKRNPRRHADRLGCPDRDGRRRRAARRRVSAGRRRQISGHSELRPLRQGPVVPGGLQEPIGRA